MFDETSKKMEGKGRLFVVKATNGLLGEFPQLMGNSIVVSSRIVREDRLTSSVVYQNILDYKGDEELSTELLTPNEVTHLDDHGIARPGTILKKGAILACRIVPRDFDNLPVDERLVLIIFGKRPIEKRDISYRYNGGDPATLILVENVIEVPDGSTRQIKMEMHVRRELRVGDTLQDNQGDRFTVTGIMPEDKMPMFDRRRVDAIIHNQAESVPLHQKGKLKSAQRVRSEKTGRMHGFPAEATVADSITLEKMTDAVETKLSARSTGYRSLIHLMPLGEGSGTDVPAQKIGLKGIETLLNAGLTSNVKMVTSINADANGRIKEQACRAILLNNPVINDCIPEVTYELVARLRSLGFYVTFPTANTELEWEDLIPNEEIPHAGSLHKKDNDLIAKGKVPIGIRIRPMTDDEVLNLSCGKISNPETINYRTMKPMPRGLYCQVTFGPINEYACDCRRYKGFKFNGIVCDKCGVEVTIPEVRRRRFGHIELPMPVTHPWTGLPMNVIPVLPPDLRPMPRIRSNVFATTDCTDLYRALVNRSNRVRKMMEIKAPEPILDHEQRLMQMAVNALFDNEELDSPKVGLYNRPLRSLKTELEKCLDRVFSRRCDFSARGVVVPCVDIDEDRIELPRTMAVELFNPMLIRLISSTYEFKNIKRAQYIVNEHPESVKVFDALTAIFATRTNPVIVLNEAETDCAVCYPALGDGEAIGVHPNTARKLALNFNGDGVKIFLPLSPEAISEAKDGIKTDMKKVESNLSTIDLDSLLKKGSGVSILSSLDQIVLGLAK